MDSSVLPKHHSLFHRTSQIVSSAMSIDEMLEQLIALTLEVTHCDACLIYLPDYETNEIVLRASQLPHAAEIGNVRMRMGEGVTGWVAQNKSIVALASNCSADSRFKRISALVEDTYEAFLSVPLISNGDTIGVLNIHFKEPHEHTPLEISLVSFLGEQIGCAIAFAQLAEDHSRLQKESREIREQLETRKLTERAKAILRRRYNLSEEEAYLKLRDESRRLRKPVRVIAEAVLLVEGLVAGENKASES